MWLLGETDEINPVGGLLGKTKGNPARLTEPGPTHFWQLIHSSSSNGRHQVAHRDVRLEYF